MVSAQTLRVCREGKPVSTFPDHALAAGALSAVDMQYLAGDEGRAFEIEHGIDDIADLAHAPDRMQIAEEFMRFRLMHRRLDHAGCHRVDANALLCKLYGERLGCRV